MPPPQRYDVAIVGGGPAGLAAALVLGRSRKSVLLIDGGAPRNERATYIAGFITQDRIAPSAFRSTAHADLAAYPTVALRLDTMVRQIRREEDLVVRLDDGELVVRRILLCTGLVDEVPPIPGLAELWGTSVFQCPYCHAYESRDKALGFIAPTCDDAEWALLLRGWSRDVMVFTAGAYPVSDVLRARLRAAAIPLEERRIEHLAVDGGRLSAIVLEGGETIPRDALFVRARQHQVGCVAALTPKLTDRGYVATDDDYGTSIPGVFAAGDLATHYHGALSAAAAGSEAAHAINHELTRDLVAQGLL